MDVPDALQPLDETWERALAVVAHPDDAELLCAGTLARAKQDGAMIGVCVLCQGDKGQSATPIADLAQVRRLEMAAAAGLLEAELLLGDIPDGELLDAPAHRRMLMGLYRRFRPTLVLAHHPGDYHPDHRAASALAEAATWFSASPGQKADEPPLAVQPALWWLDTVNMTGFEPSFFIDITPFVDLKHQLLCCHQSQLQRSGQTDFSPLDDLMRLQYTTRGAQSGVTAAEAFRAHLAWKRSRAW
jgi:LmbE family N-acetylglucosaminyl deacetylase